MPHVFDGPQRNLLQRGIKKIQPFACQQSIALSKVAPGYGDGCVSECHLIGHLDRSTVLVGPQPHPPSSARRLTQPNPRHPTFFQPSANTPLRNSKLDFRNSCWLRVLRGRVCRGWRSFCLLRVPLPSPCVLRVRVGKQWPRSHPNYVHVYTSHMHQGLLRRQDCCCRGPQYMAHGGWCSKHRPLR